MFQPSEARPPSSKAAQATAIVNNAKQANRERRLRELRHGGVLRNPFLLRLDQDLDTSQRPVLQTWFGPQHTVRPQQVSVRPQEVFPQQVAPRVAQNGWEPVRQHSSKRPQEVLPQHVRPIAPLQNFFPLVAVQQASPAAQDVLPQHIRPVAPLQNFCPLVAVQQAWPAAQDVLPQHARPAPLQNFAPVVAVQQVAPDAQALLPQQVSASLTQKLATPVPGQHFRPLPHAGAHVTLGLCSVGLWDSACLTPNAASRPPVNTRPSAFKACRRGWGLARMRAASSKRLPISFSLIQQNKQRCGNSRP